MSEKRLIGISLFPPERTNVDISELVTMQVSPTPGGGYFLLDINVIGTALREILKAKDTSETTVFIALEVLEVGERRRRTRQEGAA